MHLRFHRRANRSDSMQRLRKRMGKSNVAFALFGAAFLVLLPLLVPVAVTQNWIRTRRILNLACNSDCVACGARLGAEAIHRANERWKTIVANVRAKSPGMRFRLVCDIDAICPSCGQGYAYQETVRSLVPKTVAR